MKKSRIILSVLAALAYCGCGGWTKTDTAWQIAGLAVQLVDYGQTQQIAAHPDRWHEINPIMGQHPSSQEVNWYFAASALARFGFAAALPPRYRRLFQVGCTASSMALVSSNLAAGIEP